MSGKRTSLLRARIQGDTKLTGAIREQVNQDHHAGEGDLRVVALDKIDRNPQNPRRLLISTEGVIALRERAFEISGADRSADPSPAFFSSISDLIEQIDDEDQRKQIEGIYLLSKSIAKRGLIQPISVFGGDDRRYTIMAGERRFLAHLLMGRGSIRALVREKIGDELEERAGSLIENIAREDLSTAEKVDYIEELVRLYEARNPGQSMTPEDLHELIHESVRTCRRYLRFIQSPPDVREAIRAGNLSTVREIDEALKKDDKTESSPTDTTHSSQPSSIAPPSPARRGRQRVAVSLGKTQRTDIVRALVLAWHQANGEEDRFQSVDWSDLDQAQEAWNRFLLEVEKQANPSV
ncbi:MAG: ParB/RepB/Spo0J family partition protein [Chloroflexota bacterium]